MVARFSLLVFCLLVTGCASKKNYVWIDPTTLSNQPIDERETYTLASNPSASAEASFEDDFGSFSLNSGAFHKLAEVQESLAGKRQEAIKRVTDELITLANARADGEYQLAKLELRSQLGNIWEGYEEELRVLFEVYSKKESPLLLVVATYAGMPYEEARLRLRPTHPFYPYTKMKLEDAQGELTKLQKEFKDQATVLLDDAFEKEGRILASLDASFAVQRELYLESAREEAQRLVEDAIEQEFNVNEATEFLVVSLPGVAAESQVKGTNSESVSVEYTVSKESDHQAEVDAYLGEYGYTLATKKELGRDVTEEFVEWRKKFKLGN